MEAIRFLGKDARVRKAAMFFASEDGHTRPNTILSVSAMVGAGVIATALFPEMAHAACNQIVTGCDPAWRTGFACYGTNSGAIAAGGGAAACNAAAGPNCWSWIDTSCKPGWDYCCL